MALGIAVRDPDVDLAANAVVACQPSGDYLVQTLTTALEGWPGARGPRTAALTAMRLAAIDGAAFPEVAMALPIGGAQEPVRAKSGAGMVQSIAKQGSHLVITMKHTSALFDVCTDRRMTNRIYRIDPSGNVYYESVCVAYESRREDTTPGPFTIDARYATAVKPGTYAAVVGSVVEGVWSAANAPRPVAVFGIAVK
jgi:hypothetical protein